MDSTHGQQLGVDTHTWRSGYTYWIADLVYMYTTHTIIHIYTIISGSDGSIGGGVCLVHVDAGTVCSTSNGKLCREKSLNTVGSG